MEKNPTDSDIIYGILEERISYLELLKSFHRELQDIIKKHISIEKYTLEELLQEIVNSIHKRFHISMVHIQTLDEIANELVLMVAAGEEIDAVAPHIKQFRVKVGEGITGIVVKTGETIVVNDVSKDARYIKGPVSNTKSEICIPIKIKNKIVGVLNLEDKQLYRFKKDFVQLMEDVAISISFALENKKLYDELKQHASHLERRSGEAFFELRKSEERYRSLIENATDAILTLDLNAHITWANKSTFTLFGYEQKELVEENISKIVAKGSIKTFFTCFDSIISGKEVKQTQIEFATKDGGKKTIEASFAAFSEKGRITGVEAILRDITEKKLLENYKKIYMSRLEEEVAERTKRLKETQRAAILAIANLAESIDTDARGHLERIRNYSKILAEELRNNIKYKDQITDEYISLIYDLSPLHDIGKVGIRDYLLLKPDKLTSEEFEIMKQHADIGAKALKIAGETVHRETIFSIGEMIAHFHHERWDGTGYPPVPLDSGVRPLKGEEIPLCARIVNLADVYDALTSKRPYKEPFPHEVAKEIIVKDSEKQFDPDVVSAFLKREEDFIKIKKQYQEVDEARPFELPARDRDRQTMVMYQQKWAKKLELKEEKNVQEV